MIKLFLVFIILILLATFIFVFFYTGHEYECTLPNGGYLIIRWDEKASKIKILHWKHGKKKPVRDNTFRIYGNEKI